MLFGDHAHQNETNYAVVVVTNNTGTMSSSSLAACCIEDSKYYIAHSSLLTLLAFWDGRCRRSDVPLGEGIATNVILPDREDSQESASINAPISW